jgi:hypothetical protein
MKPLTYTILLFVTMMLTSCVPSVLLLSARDYNKTEDKSSTVLANHLLSHRYNPYSQYRESSIYSTDNRELVFLRRMEMKTVQADIEFVNYFFQIIFMDLDKKIEVEAHNVHAAILILDQNGVFDFGSINANAVENMVKKYGDNRLSERNTSNVILITP